MSMKMLLVLYTFQLFFVSLFFGGKYLILRDAFFLFGSLLIKKSSIMIRYVRNVT